MAEFSKYIGMDVHKETVAVAEGEGGAVRYLGRIPNNAEAVRRLLKRLAGEAGEGGRLRFCYEAGPCGYGLYRRLVSPVGIAGWPPPGTLARSWRRR